MATSFSDLLARADEETLQELVGLHAVRLLNTLDPSLATVRKLRTICMQLHAPESILRNPAARNLVLSLLRPHDARELAEILGFNSDNPFQALLTANFRRHSSSERALFSFLGVVPRDEVHPRQQDPVVESAPQYGLFDHQRLAHREILQALSASPSRVVLHMPTGAGKTRTALHVIATELRRVEPTVIVWLAYSEELCEQAAEEFEKAWSYLGDRHVEVYRFWGAERTIAVEDVRDGFMVAGLSKTYEKAKRDANFLARLADRTSLVIIDEAHQAIAESYRFLLNYLVERHPGTGLLGLTATPGRTWNDPDVDEELAEFFARRKVTLRVSGYSNPIDFLIEEGYLAQPIFRAMPYTPDQPLGEAELAELASSLDVPDAILRRLAEDEQRNMLIVSAIEDLLRRHSRILVFAATVEHAVLLATVLTARGIDAAAITASTPRSERSRVISRYRNADPEPRVLCNYGVLTAGFDAPQTSGAVIARPTRSLVLYSQMVGRATRGPKAGGNAEAEVITVVDTHLPGFRDISEAFMNWEDVWND